MKKRGSLLILLMILYINACPQSFKRRIDDLIAHTGGCEYVSLSDPSDSNSLFFGSLIWTELFFVKIEKELNADFPYTQIVKEIKGKQYRLECEDYRSVKQLYVAWWDKKRRLSKNIILKNTPFGEALLGSQYKWK